MAPRPSVVILAGPNGAGKSTAAADAIERHRRAGTPVVMSRDGRVDYVPAERLVPDIDTLLKDVDFDMKRTATDLVAWFEERLAAINACMLAKEPALLHQGRFKKFYEELYPFASSSATSMQAVTT